MFTHHLKITVYIPFPNIQLAANPLQNSAGDPSRGSFLQSPCSWRIPSLTNIFSLNFQFEVEWKIRNVFFGDFEQKWNKILKSFFSLFFLSRLVTS